MQLRRRTNHTLVSLDEQSNEGVPIWPERLADSAPDAEEALRGVQAHENLKRIVENLPIRLRIAFHLQMFEGLTTSKTTTALNIPKGTLKAQFFRARRQVTAQMRALEFPNRCDSGVS